MSDYSNLNIVVIYGSYRRNRKGIRAAKYAVSRLSGLCKTHFVDAREVGLPMLDLRYFEYPEGEAPKNMADLAATLRQADGYVIVTGEYNRSLPPGLSNLLDHYTTEYRDKPAGIVSYSSGSFGGVRADEHLRAVVGNLGMVSLPTYLPIPKVQDAFDESGTAKDPKADGRFDRFAEKFLAYAEVLKEAREQGRLG